jgi:hypothetical protein
MAFFAYLVVLFAGGLLNWSIRNKMIGQVNRCLPLDEQIRRSMWSRTGLASGEQGRLWRTHKCLFPHSFLPLWYVGTFIFTLSWMFFGLKLVNLVNKVG